MMTPRLVELHRVLNGTGSLYLHCDPTASHYLKIILDAIFGAQFFKNEIIWKRSSTVKGNFGQGSRHFGAQTDTILFYTKSHQSTFNQPFGPYSQGYIDKSYRHVEEGTGRRYRLVSMIGPGGAAKGNPSYEVMGVTRYWRYSKERMQELIDAGLVVQTKPGNVPSRKYYLDEGKGVPVQSLWGDVKALQASSAERLGYPTQKPLELLERIIGASSDPGDVVLDPFCGCGTTVDAAEKLGRLWIGIDVTYLAVDLIDKRLRDTHGDDITESYTIEGIPHDMGGAKALFAANPFDFERWAVSVLNGQPNQKQVGDRGIDGRIRFALELNRAGTGVKRSGTVIISVKGGRTVNPAMVRDLDGTVRTENAAMGVLVTMTEPTRGMKQAAANGGTYTWPYNGQVFPRMQIITVQQLLDGEQPEIPPVLANPYKQARTLFDDGAEAQSLF